jgi:hypothetical protein
VGLGAGCQDARRLEGVDAGPGVKIVTVMKNPLFSLSIGLLSAAVSLGAQQTWTGKIADSACGVKHEEAAEGQGVMPDRDCTQACVRGGSKYILVVDGKVMKIANQDNKDLAVHAGHTVKVTGELKGDTITVSTVEMQK